MNGHPEFALLLPEVATAAWAETWFRHRPGGSLAEAHREVS